jgi:chemotaxis protein CheD
MGEIAVANTELVTFVGSCIALCLYDPGAKVGGMAHVMLPAGNEKFTGSRPGKYADQAVENLVKMMVSKGAEISRLRAKIAGGAKIFTHEDGNGHFNIGERNAEVLKKILRQKCIPILSEDVGMNYGRRIRFNAETGELIVYSRTEGERKL